ncbi:MAG: envelope stress response membrane protein PspB [Sphingomonadaceae bacterium]
MDDWTILIPLLAIFSIFIGFPWLVFHYITKWKQAKTLTVDDENLLDDMHDTARRLEDRLVTIERIMAADNPNWKHGA